MAQSGCDKAHAIIADPPYGIRWESKTLIEHDDAFYKKLEVCGAS